MCTDHITFVNNVVRSSVIVQTSTSGLEDSRTTHSRSDGGKRSIEILDISNIVVDLSARLYKHRERFVSISVLSSERSVRGTLCVLHEKRIATAESVLIRGHGVSTMCLIDSYFTLVPHVEKALLRVHVSFRCNPARGVQSDTLISSLEILPCHSECDRVLGLYILGLGDTCGFGCCDAYLCLSAKRELSIS